MKRTMILVFGMVASLLIGGCPTTPTPTTPTDVPDGDPVIPTTPALSISATASVLQLNAAGLPASEVRFPRQALLSAVLVNADAVSFDWSILSPAQPLVAFVLDDDSESPTATGASALVRVTTASEDIDDHELQVLATLTDGSTLAAQITIQVQRDQAIQGETTVPTVLVTADPANGTAPNGTVTLETVVSGFDAGLQFAWSIPDNTPADATLALPGNTTSSTLELAIPVGTSGVFPVQVQVTDQIGGTALALTNVFLGVVDLTLDVAVGNFVIANGLADVTLRTVRVGGADDDITYEWVVEVDGVPVANPNINPPSGTVDADAENDWTFSDLAPGSYRFIGTATDGVGNTVTQTTALAVSEAIGLAVSPTRSQVGVGAAFSLRTTRTGGDGTFTYTLAARDSAGNDVSGATTFTPPSGSPEAAAQTAFDVTGFATPDTYELAVTVTDSFGNSATAVTPVVVGDTLSIDAKADDLFVDPSGNTSVTFDVNGGVPPYTYTFATVTNAVGVAVFGTPSPAANAGDLTVNWTAPAAGAGVNGTYRVEVTVTDTAGNTAIDSIPIEVGNGGANFAVDAQAKVTQVGVTSAAAPILRTERNGGTGPFTYDWEVLTEGNVDVEGGTITIVPPADLSLETLEWTANIAAATPGTYRFVVEVTDNGSSATASSSATILVGDVLTAAMTARSAHIAPGSVTEITVTPNGGSGTYSYAFTAIDAEGDAAGTLSANPGNGATGAVNWVAPTDGSGTYQIQVTVSDASLDFSTTAVLPIEVSNYMTNALILDAPAAEDVAGGGGSFEPGADLNSLGGAAAVVDFVPATTDPGLGFARSLNVRFFDDNTAGLTINSVEFIGTNQRGEPIRQVQNAVATNATVDFAVPFRTLDRVRVDYASADAGDLIEIGLGEHFGLPDPFATRSESAADRSMHVIASDDGFNANPQIVGDYVLPDDNTFFDIAFATPDQQGIRFLDLGGGDFAPDGTRDYNISFEPLTSIFVDIDIDTVFLDASDGDDGHLTVDVHGGVPPYTYDLEHLGTLGATSDATVAFPDGTNFAGENGDLPSAASSEIRAVAGGAPGAIEIHWIRVQVTDANGDAAVSTVPLVINP